MRWTLPALAALAAVVTSPLAAQAPLDSLARARHLATWFLDGEMDSVLAYVHPDARNDITAEFLRERLGFLAQRVGSEGEVVEERFVRRHGQTQYWRTAWYSDFTDDSVTLRLVLVDGMLAGMGMNPTANNPPIDP